MSIFYQRLFNFFSLRWNVMKNFLIKWLFIIPTWLKLSDYSSFSYNPDFRNLTRGGLVGARRLHTMDRNQSNLTPVCSSIHALKHTSEHSVEQLWHWLCDNHRFCIQTLTDKKLIAVMKGTPKSMSNRCHDPNRTCSPTTGALLRLSEPVSSQSDRLLSLWPMENGNDFLLLLLRQWKISFTCADSVQQLSIKKLTFITILQKPTAN